jgi:tripartite-type tricarboxylate transporter receptor subunit TctC
MLEAKEMNRTRLRCSDRINGLVKEILGISPFHFLLPAGASLWFITFLFVGPPPALAEDFYKGKNLRFIVGFAAGGGYDAYTRLVAKYISRHIPGNPSTVVENMDGAGSVIAANHMYNKATRDGLTVGIWNSHNVFNQMMGDPSIKFDGRKFGWIGTPSKDSVACAIMGFSGPKTFDEVVKSKKPIRMGATRAGNTTQLPEMLNRWAGAKFEIIPGYTGTSKIRLAMRSHEVDGACWTWDSMRSTARSMIDAKGDEKMIPFIVADRWEDPEVKNLPLFREVIKDKDNLHAFNTWNSANEFARPFSLPPGSPPEALSVLRKAFKATMEDKDYMADANKSKLPVDYTSGEKIEQYVEQIYSVSPDMKQRLDFLFKKPRTS